MNLSALRAASGAIIGRDHMARQANYQDAHALLQSDSALVAVVCDGCGDGPCSEVGARLGAQFIAAEAMRMLESGVHIDDLPATLYGVTLDYLRALIALSAPINPVGFIRDHLLFTVIGVALTAKGGVIFAAGDGFIFIDEQTIRLDQQNTPYYIAYHLVDPAGLSTRTPLPETFDTFPLAANWRRVAIATDGFEADALPQVWERFDHPRGVQRLFNVLSNMEKRFSDDCTLIAVQKEIAP